MFQLTLPNIVLDLKNIFCSAKIFCALVLKTYSSKLFPENKTKYGQRISVAIDYQHDWINMNLNTCASDEYESHGSFTNMEKEFEEDKISQY